MQDQKPGQYLLIAFLIPSTQLHTLPQHDSKETLSVELDQGKNLLPVFMYLSKLFYSADLSTAHFIPFFLELLQILFGFLFPAVFQ